jgi:hypothetical protein
MGANFNLQDEYDSKRMYRQTADYLKKGPPAAFIQDSNMLETKVSGHATGKQHTAEVTYYSQGETRQHVTRIGRDTSCKNTNPIDILEIRGSSDCSAAASRRCTRPDPSYCGPLSCSTRLAPVLLLAPYHTVTLYDRTCEDHDTVDDTITP